MSDKPTVTVSAIWLRRSSDEVVVEAEIDGVWREVVREYCEGPFSHIAEARGADRWPRSAMNLKASAP